MTFKLSPAYSFDKNLINYPLVYKDGNSTAQKNAVFRISNQALNFVFINSKSFDYF